MTNEATKPHAAGLFPPVYISATAVDLIEDFQADIGRHAISSGNEAIQASYSAFLGSKSSLFEYIAGMEKQLDIKRRVVVRFA